MADGTGDGFVNWANVSGTAITTTGSSLTAQRQRSGAFTLVAGRNYRCVMKAGNSKSGLTLYCAKIVLQQTDGAQLGKGTAQNFFGGTGGASEANQAIGQSFKIRAASTVSAVVLRLKKTATPTDTINVDLVSSLGGSSLANATLDLSTLSTAFANKTLTFGTPVALAANTTYYVQITRTVARDTTNFGSSDSSVGGYSDGALQVKSNTVWTADSGDQDLYFQLIGNTGLSLIEPQYLLSNTLLAAGTGFQTYLSSLDPTTTEWAYGSGTLTFSAAADSANGSTSVATVQKSDGSATYATVTSPDNQGISAFSSVPGSATTVDVKATTNGGDVYAVRVLAAWVYNATITYNPGFFLMFPGYLE